MYGTPEVQVKFAYTRRYRDQHGKPRIEYRRNGKTMALRGTPGTAEFQTSYVAAPALFESHGVFPAVGAIGKGTLRWLCVEYFKAAEFEQLAPSTQRALRLVFEGMLRESISPRSPLVFADC